MQNIKNQRSETMNKQIKKRIQDLYDRFKAETAHRKNYVIPCPMCLGNRFPAEICPNCNGNGWVESKE